ncbi:amino acid carrier protein [Abyssibacter sp.]|uniref:alanine/glycine:cation symporter family protein n=1 Tax=Abyssibacter sp. TaxID=2320200 RepID=UPI0025C32D66|nr:amino acid carrier protein [Abyssibacter sp.]MCK5858688.1 alanine:cation symporter family protein [Abyssibacter sp.]
MQKFFDIINAINGVMLSVPMLLALLAVGLLFTIWTRFCQFRSLTHGVGLLTGRWTSGDGAGAISHFQALSAALSATVGLGNIAGVAIAVELGGPGAVFWMWMIGLVGMAVKTTEVTLSMLYRDTTDPDNPHGGTMWVAKRALPELSGRLKTAGPVIGGLFTLPLILFALTGGNMFQAWSVSDTTHAYFGVPPWISGLVLATIVGLVILGGIRRIGIIAGTLVPLMCAIYIVAGLFVIFINRDVVPDVFALIFTSAFSAAEGTGAFVGASFGTAFIFGMKRALFSSEAGLGSAPIAHSAVKTDEPVTEGVVAGLEPFIDTIVVCTITALVILSSGIWQRQAAGSFEPPVELVQTAAGWQPSVTELPDGDWQAGAQVFTIIEIDGERTRLYGRVSGDQNLQWRSVVSDTQPRLLDNGLYADYTGATLTAKAFDSGADGLGKWMVTMAVWLFAISTIITWSYYGEQGVIYLAGPRWVVPYRAVWCVLIVVTCLGFIRTSGELDSISTVALGFMLVINLPIMLLLGSRMVHQYRDYFDRIRRGEIRPNNG